MFLFLAVLILSRFIDLFNEIHRPAGVSTIEKASVESTIDEPQPMSEDAARSVEAFLFRMKGRANGTFEAGASTSCV